MIKIMIIKLGALGDVVRTLAILPALKEKYPESEIYWITKSNALELFESNPYIKKVFALPYNPTKKDAFDILYNFDIEEEATKLASEINAKTKLGFYSNEGFPAAFNLPSEYYLNTLFDDELKKTNKKTYQQMMFESAELKWKNQHCPIFLSKKDEQYAENFVKENNINLKKLIGIHMGASPRWPSKVWHEDNLKEFIEKAKQKGYEILLFGGPNEEEKHRKLVEELESKGVKVFINNPKNTLKEFTSLVNICEKMVCSDSLALHVSLAMRKPTMGLFFCTTPHEVEDYNLLKKIISPKFEEFFPEKMDQFDEKLIKSISSDEVLSAIEDKK